MNVHVHARRGLRVFTSLAAVAVATLGLAAVSTGTAVAAGKTTLFVASSGGTDSANNCTAKATPCATIAHAMTLVAPTGSIIKLLDAGPYDEQVTVNKNTVTIQSAVGNSSIEPSTHTTNAQKPDGTPIVTILNVAPGVTGFTLKNVTVDGSAWGVPACFATPYYGLYVHSAKATLTNSSVQHIIPQPGHDGCQNGVAVYVRSDASPAAKLTVTGKNSSITDYNKNGVACVDPITVCNFTGTTVTGVGLTAVTAQNGFEYEYGTSGTMKHVTVSGNAYTGPTYGASNVLIYDSGAVTLTNSTTYGGNYNVAVYNNGVPGGVPGCTATLCSASNVTIQKTKSYDTKANGDPSDFDGIDLDGVSFASVTKNTVYGNAGGGISLWGVQSSTVANNTVNDHGAGDPNSVGILVDSYAGNVNATSTGNSITANKVSNNTADGIQAGTDAQGNTFTNNKLITNGAYNAEDSSTGGGTAGTANGWSANTCNPSGSSSPLGLC